MNLEDVKTAFEQAYQYSGDEGIAIESRVQEGELRIEVRHRDVDETRGFDVVAMPLPSEERSAQELGEAVARVVEQELAYGQLPAQGDDGSFKHIVV